MKQKKGCLTVWCKMIRSFDVFLNQTHVAESQDVPACLWEAQTECPGEVREISCFLVELKENSVSVLVRELEEKIIESFRCGQIFTDYL